MFIFHDIRMFNCQVIQSKWRSQIYEQMFVNLTSSLHFYQAANLPSSDITDAGDHSPPLSFPSLLSLLNFPLEGSPLISIYGVWRALLIPLVGSGAEPQPIWNFVNFCLKIGHLEAMVWIILLTLNWPNFANSKDKISRHAKRGIAQCPLNMPLRVMDLGVRVAQRDQRAECRGP